MGGSVSSVLIALAAFGITFGLVRLVTVTLRKRRAAEAQRQAVRNQSRQVRRAGERRKKA